MVKLEKFNPRFTFTTICGNVRTPGVADMKFCLAADRLKQISSETFKFIKFLVMQ